MPRPTALASLALLALLALLASLPSPAASQEPASGMGAVVELQDPAGDVATDVGGVAGAGGQEAYPEADLAGLRVEETKSSIRFTLRAAALPSQQSGGAADGLRYEVFFTHNGREFWLEALLRGDGVSEPFLFVYYRDPGSQWSVQSASDDLLVDAAAKSVTVDLLRDDLADADGTAPYPGRALDGIHAQTRTGGSRQEFSGFLGIPPATAPYGIGDLLPDAEPWPALPIQLGLAQTGSAFLASDVPFRASNGEATTFVFNVTAENRGAARDTYEIEATSVPAGYTAVVPVPFVAIEAGQSVQMPVLLSMPFGHQHGAVASMVLEQRSTSDPGSIGRLELGIRFLEVPQPAGHHDTVYLHRAAAGNALEATPLFSFGQEYMNTLEEDPNDGGGNSYTSGFSGSGNNFTTEWAFPLQPALEMGLHVDAARTGRFAIPVGTTLPMPGSHVAVTLAVARDQFARFTDSEVPLAYGRSAAADLAPAGQHLFEGDLAPVAEADRIPYEPGQNLWLFVELTANAPPGLGFANDGPFLAPGAHATLPLREWHDPVDEVLSALDGPGLSPLGPQERLVNPGKAAVFPVSIANPLDDAVRFELEVSGPNAAWASLSGGSLSVPAHATGQATVTVRVPPAAVDGERADLVLQAYPRDDPAARGLLRLVAEVDTDAEHPDDLAGAASAPAKESPGASGPAASLAVAAAAAVALARRRAGPR